MDTKLLGARIRQARESQGISQEELAHLMSRDQRAISEYENGKRRLAAVDLPRLASVLNVSLLYFFEDVPNIHDLEYTLLEEFRQLETPAAQKILVEMARVLVKAFSTGL